MADTTEWGERSTNHVASVLFYTRSPFIHHELPLVLLNRHQSLSVCDTGGDTIGFVLGRLSSATVHSSLPSSLRKVWVPSTFKVIPVALSDSSHIAQHTPVAHTLRIITVLEAISTLYHSSTSRPPHSLTALSIPIILVVVDSDDVTAFFICVYSSKYPVRDANKFLRDTRLTCTHQNLRFNSPGPYVVFVWRSANGPFATPLAIDQLVTAADADLVAYPLDSSLRLANAEVFSVRFLLAHSPLSPALTLNFARWQALAVVFSPPTTPEVTLTTESESSDDEV